jgi:hypothetical protein
LLLTNEYEIKHENMQVQEAMTNFYTGKDNEICNPEKGQEVHWIYAIVKNT